MMYGLRVQGIETSSKVLLWQGLSPTFILEFCSSRAYNQLCLEDLLRQGLQSALLIGFTLSGRVSSYNHRVLLYPGL